MKNYDFSNSYLKLIFNGDSINGLAENASSNAITGLSIALHTNNPTATGLQSHYECSYSPYSRQIVARTSGGWTVEDNFVFPVSTITFPTATGITTESASYWSVGTGLSSEDILYIGEISPSISISSGVTPFLSANTYIEEL